MKEKSSFGMWILDVFAAMMRGLFPRFCVKFLTLKSRKYATKFLPGCEVEMRIIRKKDYDDSFINSRRWSVNTRVELLRQDVKVLLNDVATAAEFEVVSASNCVDTIVKAMRVYTPDRSMMLTLLKEKEAQLVAKLAKAVPAAFASLDAKDILGVGPGEKIDMKSPRWDIAVVLAKSVPAWSIAFLELLKQDERGCVDGKEMYFAYFFTHALKAGKNVADFMRIALGLTPHLVGCVLQSCGTYKYFAQCFRAVFPTLVSNLRKDEVFDAYMMADSVNASLVVRCINIAFISTDKDIVDCVIFQAKALCAHLQQQEAEHLLKHLCNNVWCTYHVRTLLRLVKNPNLVKQLRRSLVLFSRGEELCLDFPFVGWEQDTAKEAIASLVKAQKFPVNRLQELPQELSQYAVKAMECATQIEAIKRGKASELVTLKRLYPEAERFLFSRNCGTSLFTYIKNFKMHASTFLYLLNEQENSMVNKQLLYAYVGKWGLTEEQYYALMQSKYCEEAPFLASQVCKSE